MSANRTTYRTSQVLQWMLLIAAAMLALLLALQQVAGAEPMNGEEEPELLPPMEQVAVPMDVSTPRIDAAIPVEPVADLGARTWHVIKLQASGNLDRAIAEWHLLPAAGRLELWRHVALAAAYLERGQLDDAAQSLERAQAIEPDNAVVHYYLGLMRLEEAALAHDWNDAIGPVHVRLAAYRPQEVMPNTRSMYQLVGMMELERAIAKAGRLDRQEALVPAEWAADWATGPRVNDLLVAIGADRFEGNAHNVLGAMYLERYQLEQAEAHMDLAQQLGERILRGYRDLGAQYERDGRYFDAARAFAKSLQQGTDVAVPTQRFFSNLWKGIFQGS